MCMNTENKVRWYHYMLSLLGFGKKDKPVEVVKVIIPQNEDEALINIPVEHHYKCADCNSHVTITGEFMNVKPSKLTTDLFPIKQEGVCRFCRRAVNIEIVDGRYKPI